MRIRYCFLILLILLNIVCLYLIIDLANYDEMISYLKNGGVKFTNPRQTALVFFFTCMINLLFISASLMKSIIFSGANKNTCS